MQKLGWEVLDFDAALRSGLRADVIHLHWPDGFAFHRSFTKSLIRVGLLLCVLKWYRFRGAKIVWTIHNLRSHERFHPKLEEWFWPQFYRVLDGWIALNHFTEEQVKDIVPMRSLPRAIIPHGLYPAHTNVSTSEPPNRGKSQLLFFGKLRRYKEIPLLLKVFGELEDDSVELVIAGQCHEPQLSNYIREKKPERVNVLERFIPDDELGQLICSADAVIVPYYKSLNSGVIFLALAYGKTVIAPATPVCREICDDFGVSQVRLYEPPLSADKLQACLELPFRSQEIADDLLKRYGWPSIAEAHDKFINELKSTKR